MKIASNSLLLIFVILAFVALGALKSINTKIDRIEEKVNDQGRKVSALYGYVDAEVGLEKATQQMQQEEELGLKPVNEFRDAQYMSNAKFHPQESLFAVLAGDGTVHLIDARSKEEKLTIRIPDETANAFAFLYDGRNMVLGTQSGKLYQADLQTGQSVFLKEFGKREIARLDAGRNGRIAVGLGGSVEDSKEVNSGFIYDLQTQRILSEYAAFFRDDFQGIAISPSGDVVAIDEVNGKARGSCLFNASDGSEIKLCYHQKYGSGPLSVDVAPDNKTMATGYAPDDVIIWNTDDASVKWLFDGHSNWVVSLDFSDDGRYLASGAGDSTARIYDLQNGEEIGMVRFPGSSTYVDSVDISSDGSLLLAAVDSFVGIYEMPQQNQAQ